MKKWLLCCALGIASIVLVGHWGGLLHRNSPAATLQGNTLAYTRYQDSRRVFSIRAANMQAQMGSTAEFNQVQISFFNADDRLLALVQCQKLEADANRKQWRSKHPVQVMVQFPASSLGTWTLQARSLQFDEDSGLLRVVDVTGSGSAGRRLIAHTVQIHAGETQTLLEKMIVVNDASQQIEASQGKLNWKEKILHVNHLQMQSRNAQLQAGEAELPLDDSRIRNMRAWGGVAIQTNNDGVQRSATSLRMEADLDEKGAIRILHPHGRVHYEEASHGRTPAWQASSADAQIDPKTSRILLQGAALVQDAQMRLTAGTVLVQRTTGEVMAHDSVELTRTEADGSQTQIRANSASLRKAMGIAHFVGAARLTSTNGAFDAPYMSLQWLRHTVKADADQTHPAEMHWQISGQTENRTALHLAAQHISCDNEAHRLHASGNARMEEPNAQVQATRMDLDFEPAHTNAPMAAKLLRWNASGDIQWNSGAREARAEEIACEEENGACVLRGLNAWMRDTTQDLHLPIIKFTE